MMSQMLGADVYVIFKSFVEGKKKKSFLCLVDDEFNCCGNNVWTGEERKSFLCLVEDE